MISRATVTVAAALAAVVVGATAWLWIEATAPQSNRHGEVLIGGPFELTDQHGVTRRDSEFRGQYMLVQFGYTSCPDVCSIALDTMSRALDTLAERDGAKARQVAPIFITVDPARDTVAALNGYAANFHPRLIALTGAREQIDRTASAYRVYYAKVEAAPSEETEHAQNPAHDHGGHDHGGQAMAEPGPTHSGEDDSDKHASHGDGADADYLVNHSTVMYLMGPNGEYLTHFSHGSNPEAIARALEARISS